MRLLIVFLMVSMSHAETKDQWLCTDEATLRQGNVWFACGVGEGADEGSARKRALDRALDEFSSLCQVSSNCKGKEREVLPRRMTCLSGSGWWKCYRLIRISLY